MVILDTISVMLLGYIKYAKINIVEIAKVILILDYVMFRILLFLDQNI